MAQWLMIQLVSGGAGSIPGPEQWVECLALLQLQLGFSPLAQELPYATGAAKKEKEKPKDLYIFLTPLELKLSSIVPIKSFHLCASDFSRRRSSLSSRI